MLAGIVVATLLAPQSQTLTLYRGSAIPGSDTRYWSVEDTTLDKEKPERSYGQGLLLWGGKNKRILIRFGDLRRAIGPNRQVTSATLILNVERGTAREIRLHRFTTDWYEGPGFGEPQPAPLNGASTWAHKRFDKKSPWGWQNGGAANVAPQASSTSSISEQSAELRFEGLAEDVQQGYEREYDNRGWSIEADAEVALLSAQNGEKGPRLLIETVPVPEKRGADLSVTQIVRTPEYERYDNRGNAYVRVEVDGHESGVMMNPGNANTKKWPSDGEVVTYTATIKNVGNEQSSGFSYEFLSENKKSAGGTITLALNPGQSTEVSFTTKFRQDHSDHRNQPIGLHISPAGQDANANNNFLSIQACALNIGIWVDEGFYQKFAEKPNGAGTRAFEDWIQWQFQIWNDVFLRHSRFSFAQDGVLESVRVGRITIVPNGTLKGGAHIPNDTPSLIYDGEWGFDSSFGEAAAYIDSVRTIADRALLHEMSHQIGLIDLYQMNVDPVAKDGTGGKVRLRWQNAPVFRGEFDDFAGLMGGGDTRNDSLIPFQITIPSEATSDPVFLSPLFVSTDLYSMTDVGALNSTLGYRRGFYGEFLYSMPENIMLRIANLRGEAIETGTLYFYQMNGGLIPDSAPSFQLEIKNRTAQLPLRPTGLSSPFTTLTGHTLRPNAFGRIDVVGTNGVFLIRLDYAGQQEWAWLKAWQLTDAWFRGNKKLYAHELRFNVTDRPILERDWASKKIVIDKANSSGANLANLVDGDSSTKYQASGDVGDWIEIDIGRDRPIGEVRLYSADGSPFWKSFDILVYGTGQTVAQARRFATELDWGRAIAERRDLNSSGASVAYRARAETVRFIRIVNKSEAGGALSGVEIREVAPPVTNE